MRKIVIAISLVLTGCVGTRMESGLQALTGAPLQYAISRLGYPDGERTIAGEHLYVWSTNHEALLPVTSGSYGNVGGVGYSQTNVGLMRAQAYCTIQLSVDAGGIVRNYQYSGNVMGCQNYARMLPR